MRFRFLRPPAFVVLAALGAIATPGCRASPPPGPPTTAVRRPDLILVTIDTLRADRVGVYGGPSGLTRAIDEVGRRGVIFLDASAHVPLTLPSHASIMTGRYPIGHGVKDNSGFALGARPETLATRLHRFGYRTQAFVSSFVLNRHTGLGQGFDTYNDRFDTGRSRLTLTSLERRGPEVARDAAAWMAGAQHPFFLWVHFYDPHTPYDPPPAFRSKFPERPYDGEVATSDFALGDLLGAVPERDRAQTLVVVTSDHGESLGEHGEPEHGILLYESTLRVPFVIAGPGVRAGTVVRRPVQHADIVPTLLDLLHIPPPDDLDGVTLVPMMHDGNLNGPRASYAESAFGQLHFGWSALHAIREGDWKYIDAPDPELYDVRADPREQSNLYGRRPDEAAALARTLSRAMARGSPPDARAPIDSASAERLRSLGYVTGHLVVGQPATVAGADASGADPKRRIGDYVAYVSVFNEATAALDAGQSMQAERGFRRLVVLFPGAFEAHQYLGRALAALGDHDRAVHEFDVAIGLSPRQAILYFDAARSLAARRQFERAFQRIDEGLRLEPTSFYGHVVEGFVARLAGRVPQAVAAFEKALAINGELAVAQYQLGKIAEEGGDRAGALARYRKAIEDDPSFEDAQVALRRLERR